MSARPFRDLCPEADSRDAMTDDECNRRGYGGTRPALGGRPDSTDARGRDARPMPLLRKGQPVTGPLRVDQFRWARNTSEPDSPVTLYADLAGRGSIAEVLALIQAEYPEVTLEDLTIAGCVIWSRDSTEAERVEFQRRDEEHKQRLARWERDTYERLRLKFEADQ